MFITFEGLDGSGKTTQIRRLAASLEAEGQQVVTLRQPGGTALGDRIRAVLLDSRSEAELGTIAPEAEMALMFADRAQSLREVILPALARGSMRSPSQVRRSQAAARILGAFSPMPAVNISPSRPPNALTRPPASMAIW